MLKSLSSRVVVLALIASFFSSHLALADGPTAAQIQELDALVAKEMESLDRASNKSVVTEFENLSALIYGEKTKALMKVGPDSSKAQKDAVAKIVIRYAALKKKVDAIPGAKQAVFVKLFGDRQNSPYYGAVSQDEFKNEEYIFLYALTGSPIWLILYVLANSSND